MRPWKSSDGTWIVGGYQPQKEKTMNVRNTSRIVTTGESIVREFRIAGRGVRVEIPVSKEPISTFERAVRIFLIFTAGWLFGYLHHFLALR